MREKYKKVTIGYREVELRDEMISAIAKGNCAAAEHELKNGYPVNQKIELSRGDGAPKTMPIMIAILAKNREMIALLVHYGAKLDLGKEHAFLYACLTRDETIIRFVAGLGAKRNVWDARGMNEYRYITSEEHTWEKQKHLYDLLEELGVNVQTGGGAAIRQSILHLSDPKGKSKRAKEARIWYRHILDYMLERKADVNYCVVDSVFALKNDTPLNVAAYEGYLEGVKLLVEHGADVTIEGPSGRPYIAACQQGYRKVAAYLRQKENPKLHDEAYLTKLAREKNMPEKLIAFLKQKKPKLQDTTGEHEITYVRFLTFMELYEYKVRRTNYVVLASEIEDYDKYLLWHPTKQKVCCYDPEMEEFIEFGSFAKFWAKPFDYLDRMM